MNPAEGAPAGALKMVVAKLVAPSDTSTSTVIDPTGPQIECGKTAVDTHNDVVYSKPAPGTELKLDVIVPKTGGTKPLVVYVSGGGFVQSIKEAALDQRTFIAEAGYVVASVQYRTTTTGATYRDAVSDVKAAIRYLRAHADEYGINPAKVGVWGESAGGYLAAMTGTTNGVKTFEAGDNLDQRSDVQAVVDKFGPSDLTKIQADFDPATQEAYVGPGGSTAAFVYGPDSGMAIGADPAAVAGANPATYVDSASPAFLLFHGDDDRIISPSQTLLLHTALRAKGVDSTRYVLSGAGHGDLAAILGGDPESALPWTTAEVVGEIVAFFGKHLAS
ncbi:MAG: alpha/beta hydrolase [Amycolatopsis sp.]|uniref:alpha/beta hydrolase n=1 Tax=Amycolatopsis sp. TaxID=37632 RepID=UPI00261E28E5|nr:alpha/beta hydrolase [Amycolatopsis sp.]MCU1683987.1 alpha/beta hydrolase [Amycolatopsis sp.]